MANYKDRLSGLIGEEDDEAALTDQLCKLKQSIAQEENLLRQTEHTYREAIENRNEIRSKLESAHERRSEISELLTRFGLLEKHYQSDLNRLKGIQEAGVLVSALTEKTCPLCGAPPGVQHLDSDCDGNIDAVIVAAKAETEKIVRLHNELKETVGQLEREANHFDALILNLRAHLTAAEQSRAQLTPSLSERRASYSDLMNKQSTVQNALNILNSISELESRRSAIESAPASKVTDDTSKVDLSFSILEKFSRLLEGILKSWNFPDAERVFFDKDSRDFVIAGKPRGSRGKGMRAIIHVAFTTALLEFTRTQDLSHPGFIVLDTPLLAYREPEGDEDDLTGTDVKDCFFEYLAAKRDRQVIILENIDPPESLAQKAHISFFSKNPHSGRYGFFPI